MSNNKRKNIRAMLKSHDSESGKKKANDSDKSVSFNVTPDEDDIRRDLLVEGNITLTKMSRYLIVLRKKV
jgi:hypothetical protein